MMPTPVSSPLPSSLRLVNVPALIEYSANVEIATAIRSDSNVIGMSYDIGIGKRNASMPMKCIDQMPVPSENHQPAFIGPDHVLPRTTIASLSIESFHLAPARRGANTILELFRAQWHFP